MSIPLGIRVSDTVRWYLITIFSFLYNQSLHVANCTKATGVAESIMV